MPRFRILTCSDCARPSRVAVVTICESDRFSRCQFCGGDDWLNLPDITLHADDADLFDRVVEQEHMRYLRRLRDKKLLRDPDSPEAQPGWDDE